MKKESAGILVYRKSGGAIEVFLIHPGGPFWAKKEIGAWSIPKGERSDSEDLLKTAMREFKEETNFDINGDFKKLSPLTQKSGKVVYIWAVEGNCDPSALKSNFIDIEWPPKSGLKTKIPEADKASWFPLGEARKMIVAGQIGFLDELEKLIG